MAEWIELQASDGHTLQGWLAKPEGTAKAAVVVIQEIFGVNHHIRSVTERFASEGYLAIAPAMFDRYERGFDINYGPDDMAKARQIMPQLNIENAVLDADAARAAVAGAGKVGIVGYCFGGTVAWLGATRLSFDAASAYYGGNILKFKDETPHCPVLMHFGKLDAHIPQSTVDEIQAAQPSVPIYRYDADHGFSCDERASYDEASAKIAWSRTLAFFAENIG